MMAEPLAGYHTRLALSREEFYDLTRFLGEALEVLAKEEFPGRIGITYEEAESLSDERLLIRYELLGEKRPTDSRAGELHVPTEPRRSGTPWDESPKMKAALLPDGRVALDLARNEIPVFASCIEAVLRELAPDGSPSGENELHSRTGLSVEEAKRLMRDLSLIEAEISTRSRE